MTTPDTTAHRQFDEDELQELVASTDSGARAPQNRNIALFMAAIAFFWSVFQLWIAQPQMWFAEYLPVLNAAQTRPVHLGFAMLLAFLAYPALKSSPRNRIPLTDWVLAIVGSGTAFYVFFFYRELVDT
ncbi:MAG TPA: C4-dicarboxylate ABC transporter, partial [Orrella sp.]